MADDTRDLQEAFRRAEAELRRIDLRDFNAEVSGLNIGRIPRFHSEDFVEERRAARSGRGRGKAAEREYANLLQMLLATNPAYARLYNDTLSRLREAEAATERAIAMAQQALAEAQGTLDETLARAATLPDGTRVFRDARGQVWTEHGQRVSEDEAAAIAWRGGEPAYETFIVESEAVADSLTRLEALQGFRVNTLGHIRDRMMDQKNNPMPEAELREAQERIEQGMQHHRVNEPPAPAAVPRTSTATVSVPDLS